MRVNFFQEKTLGAGEFSADDELKLSNTSFTSINIIGSGRGTQTRADESKETIISCLKRNNASSEVSLTFENLTVKRPTSVGYGEGQMEGCFNGIGKENYKNCDIQGCVMLTLAENNGEANFTNCYFTNDATSSFGANSIFVYGRSGSTVNVNDCVFNTKRKGILYYCSGPTGPYTLNVNNCTFSGEVVDDDSAITINSETNFFGTVNINNTKVLKGFYPENEGGTLWAERANDTRNGYTKGDWTYNFDIYVDGVLVHASRLITVNGQKYQNIEDAISAAPSGSSIELGASTYKLSSGSKAWPDNLNLTFVGKGTDKSKITNLGYVPTKDAVLTFKDLTLDVEQLGSATSFGFLGASESRFENVVFSGEFHAFTGNTTIDKCHFIYNKESDKGGNGRYGLWIEFRTEGKTIVRQCQFDNGKSKGVLVNDNSGAKSNMGDILIDNCQFKSEENYKDNAAIEIHSENYLSAKTITINNTSFSGGYTKLWREKAGDIPTTWYTVIVNGNTEQTGTPNGN